MKYKITEVKPRIFLLDFKDQYTCNMMFLRYQEFYESPSSNFRGQSFTILDFIEYYSKTFGDGVFTYMVDWAGFNIPGQIIKDVWKKGIYDLNDYDKEIRDAYFKCKEKYDDGKFYIIGSVGKGFAMKHEIAHGFFYTEPQYKNKATEFVNKLAPSFRNKIYKELKRIGYSKKVYVDECQAYLATGFTETFNIKLNGEDKPFVKLYEKYYRK
jgi:hypothetical protein